MYRSSVRQASRNVNWSIAESTLVILGVISVYIILAFFAQGGPISTDVIGYANVGLNATKEPSILNRYFHVFFQAIFIRLAPSPLVGMQHFWAFLIASICGLIYLAARLFSRHSQVTHGLLAVALFLSIGDIASTAGMTLVDITGMFMMTLFIVLFIVSARQGHSSFRLITLLGFLLYLAFRTKEIGLCVGLVLFGLGLDNQHPFNWRLFLQRVLYVLLGVMAGVLFFILLNTIILHDPLFGFRLEDIHSYLRGYASNIFNYKKTPGNDNWFTAYLFTGLLIPFCLYVISAVKYARGQESYPGVRLVWLVPLAVIVFVTATVNSQWGFLPRYIYTAFPFICMLAPQFLDFDLADSNKSKQLQVILIFVSGLALISLGRLAIRIFMPGLGWDIKSFLTIVFIPVLFSILLGLSFYWKTPSLFTSIVITVLVLGIITIPLAENAKTVFVRRPNQVASQRLFYPFSAFRDQILYSPDMQLYVSLDTWNEVDMSAFVKDRNELSALFNIYFAASSRKTNFTLAAKQEDIDNDLLSSSYDYALLSHGEWKTITHDQALVSQLKQVYQVFLDEKNLVVLLIHK